VEVLRSGNAAACSGTLVTPSVVVTAAHCISQGATSIAVWTAALPGKGGKVAANYAIEATYPNPEWSAEGGLANEFLGSHVWDVGLLKLSSTVPAQVAQPRAMAHATTPKGTRMTVWGYGSAAAGTMKYYRSFAWDDNPCVASPADSGGPVIREDTGEITRIYGAFDSVTNLDYTAPLDGNWDWIQKTLKDIE